MFLSYSLMSVAATVFALRIQVDFIVALRNVADISYDAAGKENLCSHKLMKQLCFQTSANSMHDAACKENPCSHKLTP